jgi:hypothetical protein
MWVGIQFVSTVDKLIKFTPFIKFTLFIKVKNNNMVQ